MLKKTHNLLMRSKNGNIERYVILIYIMARKLATQNIAYIFWWFFTYHIKMC